MKQTLELNLTILPDEKKRIVRRLRKIISELIKLNENPFLLSYFIGMNPDMLLDKFGPDPGKPIKKRISVRDAAPSYIPESIDYLRKLKSSIEAAHKPTARSKSIDPFNFASTIAVFYTIHLKKKPTKTKNGPFYNIVLICFKAVGLREKNRDDEKVDVYNHVQAAVDGLRLSSKKFHDLRNNYWL
jgi:hypothetical protein